MGVLRGHIVDGATGEQSRLTPSTLDREGIVFKQTPYDVKTKELSGDHVLGSGS